MGSCGFLFLFMLPVGLGYCLSKDGVGVKTFSVKPLSILWFELVIL